jgi:hypothetical protein
MIGFDILSVIPVTLARRELGTTRAWQKQIGKHYTSIGARCMTSDTARESAVA